MNQPVKTNSAAPVPIAGTWDSARSWLDYSKKFEQCKLWAQVMLGFELIELKRRFGIKGAGGDRKSNSQVGNLIAGSSSQHGKSWLETLEEELKIPHTSAYRCEEMARAAAPRLKKMINAKDIDLINTPLAQLPPAQQKNLGDAVRKLTDGRTQTEFFDELYKQGGGNDNPTPGTARKLSDAELADKHRALALTDSGHMGVAVNASNKNFFLTEDLEVNAQIALLDNAIKFRRAWLAQPKGARNAAAIVKMIKEAK